MTRTGWENLKVSAGTSLGQAFCDCSDEVMNLAYFRTSQILSVESIPLDNKVTPSCVCVIKQIYMRGAMMTHQL